MPKTCVVPGCESRYPSHQFPKDPTRLREWQLAINSPHLHSLTNEELTIGRSYCVCHLHFPSDAYEKTKWPGHRRLKRDAVPILCMNPATSAPSNFRDSRNVPIEVQQLVVRDKKTAGFTDSTTKKIKKNKKSRKENGKKIALQKASRRQRIKDALKLMKTDYFQKLMASRSRSDKLYTEMQQRKTLQRPSLELMRLCQSVAQTCPEYAHEYITNMLIK